MDIFKLKYESREQGISDLLEKGIILSDLTFELPTHSVVDLGLSVLTEATETEPATYDGYCFDVMIEPIVLEIIYKEWDFGTNEILPNTPDHTFVGY